MYCKRVYHICEIQASTFLQNIPLPPLLGTFKYMNYVLHKTIMLIQLYITTDNTPHGPLQHTIMTVIKQIEKAHQF